MGCCRFLDWGLQHGGFASVFSKQFNFSVILWCVLFCWGGGVWMGVGFVVGMGFFFHCFTLGNFGKFVEKEQFGGIFAKYK